MTGEKFECPLCRDWSGSRVQLIRHGMDDHSTRSAWKHLWANDPLGFWVAVTACVVVVLVAVAFTVGS